MDRPNGPATATPGSSSAATSGDTTSPVGWMLVSRTTTTAPVARRIPAFMAAARPSGVLVRTSSCPSRAIGESSSARVDPDRGRVADPVADDHEVDALGQVASGGRHRVDRRGIAEVDGQDDRRDAGRRLVEPARHRVAAAIPNLAPVLHVGGMGGLETERRPGIGHAPAGRLDLGSELVGGRPVPGGSRFGPALRGVEHGGGRRRCLRT